MVLGWVIRANAFSFIKGLEGRSILNLQERQLERPSLIKRTTTTTLAIAPSSIAFSFPKMNSRTSISLLRRLTLFGIVASTIPNIIAATAPLALGHIYGLNFVCERYRNLGADAAIALVVIQTVTSTATLFLCFAWSFLMIWEGAKKYMPNMVDRRVDHVVGLEVLRRHIWSSCKAYPGYN